MKDGISMRTVVVTALALIVGLFAGIVLAELIGIAGFLLFDRAVGFRFLPLIVAFMCASAALSVNVLVRRGSK